MGRIHSQLALLGDYHLVTPFAILTFEKKARITSSREIQMP